MGGTSKKCPYFASGNCHKGQDCKWSHGDGGLSFAPAQSTQDFGTSQLCPYFAAGKCDKENCRWRHAVGSKAGGGGLAPGQKCPYYALGKCEKPECKWSHE